MKIENRKAIWGIGIFSVVAISLLVLGFVLSKQPETDIANLPVNYIHGDYAVNVDNPYEVVGSVDYYFVAKVEKVNNTEYRHTVNTGEKEISVPYTNYTMTVIRNIKGELVETTPIEITKFGGVSKDGKSLILYEDDIILEEGNYYAIAAFAQEDGSLLISSPNSCELIGDDASVNRSSEMMYAKYQDYFDNEITLERERFSSKYDENID